MSGAAPLLASVEWRRLYRYWLRDTAVGARLLAGHHGLRLLSTDAASAAGGRLAEIVGPRLHAAADLRMRTALRLLRPDLVPDEASMDAAAGRVWEYVGRAYAEFSAEERLWAEGRIVVEGAEHLAAARARGGPVILAGLHLANWETVPITFGYLGHRFMQVYQPPRNRFENRIALAARERVNGRFTAAAPGSGMRLVPPSATAGVELLRGLRAGEDFMIFVDEYVGGRVHGPALGRPMGTGGNMARVIRLARLAGAAVVPGYAVRTYGARFTVRFLPPLALQATGDREADLVANIAVLDAAITPPVLEHIEQWYMLTDFRIER